MTNLTRFALVKDGEGGVILGGEKQDSDYLDMLYHLKYVGNVSQSTLLTQKLE